MERRNFLKHSAAAAAMPFAARSAVALDCPTRPVQVMSLTLEERSALIVGVRRASEASVTSNGEDDTGS